MVGGCDAVRRNTNCLTVLSNVFVGRDHVTLMDVALPMSDAAEIAATGPGTSSAVLNRCTALASPTPASVKACTETAYAVPGVRPVRVTWVLIWLDLLPNVRAHPCTPLTFTMYWRSTPFGLLGTAHSRLADLRTHYNNNIIIIIISHNFINLSNVSNIFTIRPRQ